MLRSGRFGVDPTHREGVRDVLIAAIARRGGVITRDDGLQAVSRHVWDSAVSSQRIVRAHPGVYVDADRAADPGVLDLAVMAYVPGGALSHIDGLRRWDLRYRSKDGRRHVVISPDRQFRTSDSLVVHRRSGFRQELPHAIRHNGIYVVMPERAIIDSWPLLVTNDRRAPAIDAVSRGLTSGARLLAELARVGNQPGAADMRELFGLLEAGCRSELELWGHASVFSHPSLPVAVLQHRVRTYAGNFVLDRGYLEEMVGVGLDGAAWHGSKEQRESDVRRDAALAREGWLIVRFTHDRLRREPQRCREELREILAARRRQLGRAPAM